MKNKSERKPDETGTYIHNKNLTVNVWVTCTGRCHGSDDFYSVLIKTTKGKTINQFDAIYSQIPSFIVGGKPYYKS